jgi:hypothetical protein
VDWAQTGLATPLRTASTIVVVSTSSRVSGESRMRGRLDVGTAIASIDLGKYASLPQFGRLVQNVVNVYRSLDPDAPQPSTVEILKQMATLEGI